MKKIYLLLLLCMSGMGLVLCMEEDEETRRIREEIKQLEEDVQRISEEELLTELELIAQQKKELLKEEQELEKRLAGGTEIKKEQRIVIPTLKNPEKIREELQQERQELAKKVQVAQEKKRRELERIRQENEHKKQQLAKKLETLKKQGIEQELERLRLERNELQKRQKVHEHFLATEAAKSKASEERQRAIKESLAEAGQRFEQEREQKMAQQRETLQKNLNELQRSLHVLGNQLSK